MINDSNTSFWTPQLKGEYQSATARLIASPSHPMLNELYQYDGITHETLIKHKAGIITKWGKEWISFPYETGIQLYRREFGAKVIRAVDGSKPSESFFATPGGNSRELLVVAKSPRETMLLEQLIGDKAKIIGLPSGEFSSLSNKQEQHLREALKGVSSVYVMLDTDNLKSQSISISLTSNIGKIHSKETFHIDITKHSNEAYKDITDAVRNGQDSDYIMKLLNSAQNINNIRNITPSANRFDDMPKPFSDNIYKNMPEKLRGIFQLIERKKNKDVLLMASLPVIAAHLDGVYATYGSQNYSPDLYSMIIASAAAGKGYANQARQIGFHLSEFYKQENERVTDTRDSQGNTRPVKESILIKTLFFPANSSSRALYDLLHTNDGKGLIFESEIDTMLTALGQEWGNFSDLTRKAFHHEHCSLSRKGELLWIDKPKLSIFMSGTLDQFKEMFRNTENGLYSRFAFYTFESELEWISQKPTKSNNQLSLYINEFSNWLFKLNQLLNKRSNPLEIKLADHCWTQMNNFFDKKVVELKESECPEEFAGNLRRSAIILMKITMIFTLLRAYQELGDDMLNKESITAEENDFKNALRIVDTLFNHSFYLYGLLKGRNGNVFISQQMELFFNTLPVLFSTDSAHTIGAELELSTATVNRYLKKLVSSGILIKIKHGEYTKLNLN